MNPSILALDASSTTIGWCVFEGAPTDHGEITLTGRDIAERCRQAHAALQLILANHPAIDCIAIESPVNRHAKSLIPQARVSGALMAVAALKGLHVVEVAPSAASAVAVGAHPTEVEYKADWDYLRKAFDAGNIAAMKIHCGIYRLNFDDVLREISGGEVEQPGDCTGEC